MDISSAIPVLAALAQESRLRSFRLLVEHGERGLPAGEIARRIGIPHNTMSAHLAVLAQAGLIGARRDGRSMIYAVDFAAVRALLAFLMRDCCRADAAAVAPALETVRAACCD